MISAFLLTLASFSAPASPSDSAYASDTVRHLKGHASIPVSARKEGGSAVPASCHPDPVKGRVCRHRRALAEEAGRDAVLAQSQAATGVETVQ